MKKKLSNNASQILIMVCMVVLFRIIYVDLYRHLQTDYSFQSSINLMLFFENVWAILLAFGLDLCAVWQVSKHLSYVDNSQKRFWIDVSIGALVSAVSLIPIYWVELWDGELMVQWHRVVFTYLTVLMVNLIFIGIFDLIVYFRQSRQLLQKEQDKKLLAQYKYGVLKQQVNPHFLFNSLNILDYLVNAGEKARASEFIRKLASIYRYMLSVEGQELVTLEEERDFLRQYVDLLMERFPQGLLVDMDLDDSVLQRNIVPLSLQLLVENATKHNVVNQAHPLRIHITVEDEWLVVRNNLQPRLSASSTGIGLTNLNQQYQALAGKTIEIHKTEDEYVVRLPLL